jgi:endonuclease/exonuclease/phosphatase family metal-dependent hydrolase
VRVATFNLHAGVDGWGRPSRAVRAAVEIAPDVLICPETWRGDDGQDLFNELATALSMTGTFASLARAERVTTGRGGRGWQPRLAHFTGEHGLYFSEHRSLTRAQRARRAERDVEHGEWGLAILTNLEVEELRVEPLGRLAREKVNRALIVARLRDEGRVFHVLCVHGAHLSHGSFRQYRRIRQLAAQLDPAVPTIMGGDFNSWRPLLRALLPGWRSLVRARTWPARRPHSQIDHLLAKGPWRVSGGGAIDGGSDHRALYADVSLP